MSLRFDALRSAGRLRLGAAALGAALAFGLAQPTFAADADLYGPSDAGAKQGGTLQFGSLIEPPALDPFHQGSDARLRISVLMYEGLMYTNDKSELFPLLAESYDISEDGKTYTFTLRKGVKFHSGGEMTAEDVKYSYDYLRNPDNGSPGAGDYATIDSIDVVDDSTVRFNLKQANAALLMTFTNKYGGIVPKGYFDAEGAQARMNEASVGTGPFVLDEFRPNSYLRLKRNADYWQAGLPYLDGINFLFVPSSASLMVALRNERVDLAVLERPQDADQLTDAANLTVEQWPSLNQKTVDLANNHDILKNRLVRRAIALAVDKAEITEAAVGAYGSVIGTMVAGMQDRWGLPLDEVLSNKVDIEAAKAALTEAGYPDGLELDLTTIIGYDWMDPAAVTLAQQLEKIGIKLNIKKVDLGVWIDNFRSRNMGFTFNDWGTSPDPSLLYYRHFHAQPQGADFRRWDNAEASKLLDDGQQASAYDARHEIYLDFQRKLSEEVPTIMFFSADLVTVKTGKVHNFHQHPTGWYYNLVKTWKD